MPEKKEVKVLSGETSITPSSDEHVQDLYQGWHDQIYGVGDTTEGREIVEVEILTPKSVIIRDEQTPIVSLRPAPVIKLGSNHSALGQSIFNRRKKQLRRAA